MNSNFYDKVYYSKPSASNKAEKVNSAKTRETQFFKTLIYPEKGKKLLDIGCGLGLFLASVKATGADLWGIDLSKNATDYAKRIVSKPEQIICEDACPLPFKDNEFDYVTAWGTVEHFPKTQYILKEINRVAKDDGKIAIMVPNVYYYKFVWNTLRSGFGPRKHQEIEFLYSFKEWKSLIEAANLNVVRVFRHNKFNKYPMVIRLRNIIIPFYLSNHFIFICTKRSIEKIEKMMVEADLKNVEE